MMKPLHALAVLLAIATMTPARAQTTTIYGTADSTNVFNIASATQASAALADPTKAGAMTQNLRDAGLSDAQIQAVSTGDPATEGAIINNAVVNHIEGSSGQNFSSYQNQTDANNNPITTSSMTAAYLAGGNSGLTNYVQGSAGCTSVSSTCTQEQVDSTAAANTAAAASSQASAGMTSTGGFNATPFNGSQGGCMYTAPSSTDQVVQAGELAIVGLICQIHLTGYQMVTSMQGISDGTATGNSSSTSNSSLLTKGLSLVGTLFFTYALVVVALQCFEVIIRLAIYSVFFPFILFCYIFKTTRPIFDTMVKGFVYAAMHFAFLGLFLTAGLMILQQSINALNSLGSMSLSAAFTSTGLAQAIAYAATAIATGAMVSKVMTMSGKTAAVISAYDYGNIGAAAGGMAAFQTAITVGQAAAALGLSTLSAGTGAAGLGLFRGGKALAASRGLNVSNLSNPLTMTFQDVFRAGRALGKKPPATTGVQPPSP